MPQVFTIRNRFNLFALRNDKDITEEIIRDNLKDSQISARELEGVSQDGTWTISYAMTVECNAINDIVNRKFWPDSI